MSILGTNPASNNLAPLSQILLFFQTHPLLLNLKADPNLTVIRREYDDGETSYTLNEDTFDTKSEEKLLDLNQKNEVEDDNVLKITPAGENSIE